MANEAFNESRDRLQQKMSEFVDNMIGRAGGLVKTASADSTMMNHNYRRYRNSFLTMGDLQIPDNYREIFRWCRYFFKFDSLIGPAVRALATFPITDIVYNDTRESEEGTKGKRSDEKSETYKFYTNLFNEIDLHNHLIEIGYDYFLYGNCIIFAEPGVKIVRRRNTETGELIEKREVVWKYIERLDVTRVKIDRDPKTKEKIFYYDIPPELKRIIQRKEPKEKYDRIPEVFKKAVEKKGVVKLNSKFVFHLSMPSESGDAGLWGTPPTIHAMKLLLYTNILRQAQEAIAYEHIIPRRIYYFEDTQNFAPEYNFEQISDDFAFELRKQLSDPNYQVISPIPVQQIQHGGNGRALLLVPEIEQLQETILASMNCPKEFIFGGVSYSGSTISLRILENNFITYRVKLYNYVNNFLVKRLAQFRGEWEVPDDDDKLINVDFSELKMQDDVQQKQLMISMNQAGKLPDEVLYEKVFGLDARKTMDQLKNEKIQQIQDDMEVQIEAMKAQKELQAKMDMEGLEPPATDANGQPAASPTPTVGAAGATGGAPDDGTPGASGGAPQGAPQGKTPEQHLTEMSKGQAQQIAQQMLDMSEAERANIVNKLPQKSAQLVMTYYQILQQNEDANKDTKVDMRPQPERLPPRRQGGV